MCALILGSILFSKISTSFNSKGITLLNTGSMIGAFILSGTLKNKYLLLCLFLLIELLMGMMSGQISATSNEAIYGESNKSTMLSTVSFIAEILVSVSLFKSNVFCLRSVFWCCFANNTINKGERYQINHGNRS